MVCRSTSTRTRGSRGSGGGQKREESRDRAGREPGESGERAGTVRTHGDSQKSAGNDSKNAEIRESPRGGQNPGLVRVFVRVWSWFSPGLDQFRSESER